MKTQNLNENEKLLKVLERNDYKRLTKELADYCETYASLIKEKMKELDLKELEDLVIVKVSANNFYTDYLAFGDYYSHGGDLECCRAGRSSNGDYFAGNFNCWISYAKNNEALKFLNNLKHYLKLLDEIETKKSEKIKETLKEVENL